MSVWDDPTEPTRRRVLWKRQVNKGDRRRHEEKTGRKRNRIDPAENEKNAHPESADWQQRKKKRDTSLRVRQRMRCTSSIGGWVYALLSLFNVATCMTFMAFAVECSIIHATPVMGFYLIARSTRLC